MLSKVSPIGLGSKLVVIYAPPQALPPPHQISHLFSPVHRPRQHPSLGKYFFLGAGPEARGLEQIWHVFRAPR